MYDDISLQRLAEIGAQTAGEKFQNTGRYVHDWQRYIPDALEKIWAQLSDEARGAAVCVGQEAADGEDWD